MGGDAGGQRLTLLRFDRRYVGEGERYFAVTTVARAEQRVERRILGDRQELARRDQASSVTTSGERTEVAPVFLPVRVVDLETVSPPPAPPIEIVLPTGLIVRAPSGFDPRTLGHVLAVLEGRPC